MKLTLITLFLFSAICFISCRKSGINIDIKQYDQQQIQNYIAAQGITGMQRDTTGGDTTGIYYQIINPGDPNKPVDYPDIVSYVYTINSFDGKFFATDTVLNHFNGFLGHVVPNGLMLSIHNVLKNKGGKMRVLIPSHLAFGGKGVGSGSTTITNGRIAGNQCLDYTINLINDQVAYDELVIINYIAANNLSGYSKTTDGLYYKIIAPGTGSTITDNSIVTMNYTGKLMNNTIFDDVSTNTATFADLSTLTIGFTEGLKLIHGGGAISLILPSQLGYGASGFRVIPGNACLKFDISNVVVNN